MCFNVLSLVTLHTALLVCHFVVILLNKFNQQRTGLRGQCSSTLLHAPAVETPRDQTQIKTQFFLNGLRGFAKLKQIQKIQNKLG